MKSHKYFIVIDDELFDGLFTFSELEVKNETLAMRAKEFLTKEPIFEKMNGFHKANHIDNEMYQELYMIDTEYTKEQLLAVIVHDFYVNKIKLLAVLGDLVKIK